MSSTPPTQSSLPATFRRTSLLLSGGPGAAVNERINAVVDLAKDHNLSVLMDNSGHNFVKCGTADIVVIKDVTSAQDLNFLVDYYLGAAAHPSTRQFIIGTSLSLSELQLEPIEQLIANHKFTVSANSSDSYSTWSKTEITSWAAHNFLISAAVQTTSPVASPTMSGIKPTAPVLPPLTSLILMGSNEKDISKEINHLVEKVNELDAQVTISFVEPDSTPSHFFEVDIVVCNNVTKLKDLNRLIRNYSTYCRQFLIATTLAESEIRPLDASCGTHKFNYVDCSTSSFESLEDQVVSKMNSEWKTYVAAIKNSFNSIAVEEKKEDSEKHKDDRSSTKHFVNVRSLIIAGRSGCGKSSKLNHLTTFAKEAGMDVKTVDASIFQFETCDSPQVIICPNIETIDQLKSAIKHSKSTQLLLGTSLTEEELAPMKDELAGLEFDICHFKAISVEERVKAAAVIAAGGSPPTICYDWAKEWAMRGTEHWFAKEQRA